MLDDTQETPLTEEPRLALDALTDPVARGGESVLLAADGSILPRELHFDIFTLFPQMFSAPFAESIIRRALDKRLISIALHNIRDFTTDRHHVCDGTPFGGGGGMIMKPEPIVRAVETVLTRPPGWSLPPDDAYVNLPPWEMASATKLPADLPVILLTPQGRLFYRDGLSRSPRARIARP